MCTDQRSSPRTGLSPGTNADQNTNPPTLDSSSSRRDPYRTRTVTGVLCLGLLASIVLFMTYDLRGSLSFALELRARRVGALVVVGVALSYSAVLFHTITHNRILTPSLMGFDSLYVFIQTSAAYTFGTFAFLQIDPRIRFLFEVAAMLGFAMVIRRQLLSRHGDDLYLLVLVGIVVGTMFAGLTALLSRMIDPNEFITLQDQLFASFSAVDRNLLIAATITIALTIAASVPLLARLDAASLGREPAVSLGVDYDQLITRTLVIVVVQVAVATALVGPITFLGLIAANLAYRITGTFRHRHTLPVASLLAALALVAGQFALEEIFNSETRLSIIVSFVGGVTFLVLLMGQTQQP